MCALPVEKSAESGDDAHGTTRRRIDGDVSARAGVAPNSTARFSKTRSSKVLSQSVEQWRAGFGLAARAAERIERGVGRCCRTIPIGGVECARRILVRLR
ncbi:hypothetical protein CH260_15950 [Rhodococcus sp. 05-2256-B2]|jgi:hypothetical protein|nr:hypothetical protein CH258_02240 [Rhodococcus sp. 05-2256-B4]OZD94505.1 hypothetical protein CH260_15950 [Rhodococcus sp. 05-2256-B2]OZD99939.1 hypothetical protein CH257_00125 [Rhodococcus sp. 05-2256-B3]OZE08622.1 hypothetical protein CH285_01000 [Rhodococcus sp. 05-2256-B1]